MSVESLNGFSLSELPAFQSFYRFASSITSTMSLKIVPMLSSLSSTAVIYLNIEVYIPTVSKITSEFPATSTRVLSGVPHDIDMEQEGQENGKNEIKIKGIVEVVEPPVHSHFGPPIGKIRTEHGMIEFIQESGKLEEGKHEIVGTLVEGKIRIEETK